MPNFNYGNYPYGNIYQPYGMGNGGYQQNNFGQQPQMQQQPPQMQQQAQPQTAYLPLTFVSGNIGAKAFIVAPNQTVFLKDSDEGSDLLFEKSADSYGKYTLKAYHLIPVKVDDVGKPIEETPKQDIITKQDLQFFATKNDLNELFNAFETKMNDLLSSVQKGLKTAKSNTTIKENDKNE